MRTGYMLRQQMAKQAISEQTCINGCDHQRGDHHELPRVRYGIEAGEVVETPNPDYRPLHFHCDVDGCNCVVVSS